MPVSTSYELSCLVAVQFSTRTKFLWKMNICKEPFLILGGKMIEFLLHFEFLDRDDSSITYIYVIDEAYCINHLTGTYVIKLSIKLFFWVWSWHFQNRIYWYWPKKYYLHTTWNHPWNILVVMKELHSL